MSPSVKKWRTAAFSPMKKSEGTAEVSAWEVCIYIVKCFVGVAIINLLLTTFPEQKGQCYWAVISLMISIAHDNNNKAAHDRMRGNMIGSLVGFFMFFICPPPSLVGVFIGVALTIVICFKLNLIQPCRTALVALMVVMAYEKTHAHWVGSIYRASSVIVGCFIGLLINYTSQKISSLFFRGIPSESRLSDREDPNAALAHGVSSPEKKTKG